MRGTTSGNTNHSSALNAASAKNGACQPKCVAIYKPAGTPITDTTGNADITTAIARPRLSAGIRSPTMASTTDPITPPNTPAKARAMKKLQ